MAPTKTPSLARTHLIRLAVVLRQRGWQATVTGPEHRVALIVTNPVDPPVSGRVVCRNSRRGWRSCWSLRQVIGPAGRLSEVADGIVDVLRVDER